jgi:nucleoid-associated protein YgaU
MSTLEKFGILVILILVVIIGVVAVWGVGGKTDNPFQTGDIPADGVLADDGTGTAPDGTAVATGEPGWPDGGGTPPAANGAVDPPGIGTPVTAPTAAPEMTRTPAAGTTSYVVQKGDTLAGISRKTLGDSNRWKEIVAVNPGKDPRRLKIGDTLAIPSGNGTAVASNPPPKDKSKPAVKPNTFEPNKEGGTKEKPAPDPAAKPTAPPPPAPDSGMREVEVRSGDTLYKLALQYLGDSNLYYKIQAANPGLDPKKLRPGMKVKVPAK